MWATNKSCIFLSSRTELLNCSPGGDAKFGFNPHQRHVKIDLCLKLRPPGAQVSSTGTFPPTERHSDRIISKITLPRDSVPHRPPFNILQWPLVLISEALNAPTGSDPSGCHMTILLLLTGVTLLLQVTLVLRSGPSGALAQLHAVKGRRCEQERVSHLMDHTAAAL